ncbi:glycoside hydrolase family 2 TIM barrel-domain containing protein [Marinifilum caeruleilacunae]|uniref:Beta-galactosidase n=1 Tax=Marinifilum caeruleilacunae TaxID=2499076 RepID=A0ABX1X1I0_9BACT|nr:glycoside hydrolase family 2 TIM barrel-domain containing protein [Marinifilum caeruleilacunae]NOU61939.1 hypothetical protein [Marinifilum caeruleilacunae]
MGRILLILLLLSFHVQIGKAINSYTINENWQFALEGKAWKTVNLPHTWNAEDAFGDQAYYRGTGIYKKKLSIDSAQVSKALFIQFDGVNAFADLFINDQFVGQHIGGYTAFRFDISNFVHIGENDVKLIVNNELNPNYPPLDGDFTMFGGIYRDAQLIEANKLHIDLDNLSSSGVFIRQKNVSEKNADIFITSKIVNKSEFAKVAELRARIMDANNQVVSTYSKKIKIKPNDQLAIEGKLSSLKNPKLWSPDQPYLYKIIVELYDEDNQELDSRIEPLGIRWFSVDPDKGFYLNGKALKLVGVNRHQDFFGYGNAVPDEAHLKDMRLIKEMGSNFLRIAHYPQDKMILEECDRLGILCCVEVPLNNKNNVFSDEYWQNSMLRQQEMVRQSFNHPSIVIWAMLNECLLRTKLRPPYDPEDEYLKKTGEFAAAINSLLKEEDEDRLTMIVNSEKPDIHLAAGTGLTPDIIGWNLYHCWYGEEKFDNTLNDFITRMHQQFPAKGLMITEYGAGADPRISCEDPHRWDFSREYQVKVHKHFMETILGREDVMGGEVWNFADFASGVRQDTDPNINSKGLMTHDRIPKDAYHYYHVMLSDKPIVRIASGEYKQRIGIEDKTGAETCTQKIEVFGKGGDIKLTINGKLIGTKTPDQHNSAVFKVPFINGLNQLEAKCGDVADMVDIHFNLVPFDLDLYAGKINISVGDHRQFVSREPAGQAFVPEKEYTPGSWGYIGGKAIIKNGLPSVGTALNIYRTKDDPLYQSHREDIQAFQFDVNPGYFEINLLFMEPNTKLKKKPLVYELGKGRKRKEKLEKRVFDVLVNGMLVLKNFNIVEEAGARSAMEKKINVEVKNDKGIRIEFVSVEGSTILSGISLRKIR